MRRLGIAAVTVLSFCAAAAAQTYPAKPIHAVIPFGAGSATDVIPRVIFDRLGAQMGQTIIVENRPGAGGTIGALQVAKAEPDGYTLLVNSSAHSLAPALYPNLAIDMKKDFVPVAMMGSVPNVLIISPAKGIKTIKEFVAAAKARPASFNFASLGVGSAVHMSAERFRYSAGYEAVHIPFKGGAEALTEVVAGRVDYYFCPIATALPFIKEGKLLALAVSSKTRAAALPDVPTTLEAGYADSDYTLWVGVFAPAKTPKSVVAKFDEALSKAMATPELKDKLATLGVEYTPMNADVFGTLVENEIATYGDFVKKTGMKLN